MNTHASKTTTDPSTPAAEAPLSDFILEADELRAVTGGAIVVEQAGGGGGGGDSSSSSIGAP